MKQLSDEFGDDLAVIAFPTGEFQGSERVIQRRFNLAVPRARVRKNKTHASRPFREMITRPKVNQNEWKTTEI